MVSSCSPYALPINNNNICLMEVICKFNEDIGVFLQHFFFLQRLSTKIEFRNLKTQQGMAFGEVCSPLHSSLFPRGSLHPEIFTKPWVTFVDGCTKKQIYICTINC